MIIKIFFICMFLLASPCVAAENALRNIRSAPESVIAGGEDLSFAPGKIIVFPDGSREVIESHLSSGEWRTKEGSVISPLGVVMEGRHKDDVVEISTSSYHFSKNSTIVMPDGSVTLLKEQLADGSWRASSGALISSSGLVLEGPGKGKAVSLAGKDMRIAEGARITLPDGSVEEVAETLPNGNLRTKNGLILSPEGEILEGPDKGSKVALNTKEPLKNKETGAEKSGTGTAEADGEMDIADLLPSTPYPDGEGSGKSQTLVAENAGAGKGSGKGEAAGAGKGSGKGEAAGAGKGSGKGEAAGTGNGGGKGEAAGTGKGGGKGEAAGTGKGGGKGEAAGAGKGSGKGEAAGSGKGAAKARPGDPLRIPEEAVNTGNLSFLEGCWQGTRPEYFTKRTVKECFCFNANGRSGKRRVYDITQGSRMCVGATKANLSRKGVLSVTSSGAACNDGERWGGARMICRNSGPRTPCSWVFTDANNGTQAYEIPFIRVKSCGR